MYIYIMTDLKRSIEKLLIEGGGFPAFWYSFGYGKQMLRQITPKFIAGYSAGSLVAVLLLLPDTNTHGIMELFYSTSRCCNICALESLIRTTMSACLPNNIHDIANGKLGVILCATNNNHKCKMVIHWESKEELIDYVAPMLEELCAGDDDAAERLALLDGYLAGFDAPAAPLDTSIALQPLKQTPWRAEDVYPVGADAGELELRGEQEGGAETGDAGKHMVTLNWVLHEAALSNKERLALAILDHMLVGTTSAPLYQELLSSGLGTAVVGGGLSDELLQASFAIGMKGVRAEDTSKVEDLVLETLATFARDGVARDALAASMNSIEFMLREFNTGSFPRGLSIMLTALQQWNYDRDPIEALRFESALAELKEDLVAGTPVFESLVTTMLVENGHRVTLTMAPDSALEERLEAEEAGMLAAARAGLGDAGLDNVAATMALLVEQQLAEDSPEDLATIPALAIADLSRDVLDVACEERWGGGAAPHVAVLETEQTTSGIVYRSVLHFFVCSMLLSPILLFAHIFFCLDIRHVYSDVAIDARALPPRLLPLLPLFTRAMFTVGTSSASDSALQRRIGTHTGGMSASTFSSMHAAPKNGVSDPSTMEHMLVVGGKTTNDAAPHFWEIAAEVLTDAELDSPGRTVEMLKASKANRESALISSGNAFAAARLAAGGTLAGYVAERTSGVSYGDALERQLDVAVNDWPTLLAELEEIRTTVLASLRRGKATLNVTGDRAGLDACAPLADRFVASALAAAPAAPASHGAAEDGLAAWNDAWRVDFPDAVARSEGFAVTSQVNYVALGARLYEPGEYVSGASAVVQRWLSRGFLWDNVRVVGGAYGGGCNFSPYSGRILFSSYRDPNLEKTVATYMESARQLAEAAAGGLSSEALTQAIVGTVGDLDSPMTAQQKGAAAFRWRAAGETLESRQQWRDEVLATSPSDFAEFGERLHSAFEEKRTTLAVFGGVEQLRRAKETFAAEHAIELDVTDMSS